MVKIPGSELALAKKGGAEHTLIDFIGEMKDEQGTTIQNMRDNVDIKLSDATAAELAEAADRLRHRVSRCCRASTRSSFWRATMRRAGSGRIMSKFRDSESE